MIEMSLDKDGVLSCVGQTDPTLQGPSDPPRNHSGALQPPGKTMITSLSKEEVDETGSLPISDNNASNDSALEPSTQTQNGGQPPKPPQQKINKRRNTMSGGFKHPGYGKRRRRTNSESESVLPTNFLLGGNIFDPLNLNSLLDEEVNRALNAETPKSSPLPAKSGDPVEILIPRDITDPLNLNCPSAGDDAPLVSPIKSRRRHRNKHHGGGRGSGDGAIGDVPESNGCSSVQDDKPSMGIEVKAPVSEEQRPPAESTNGGETKEKTNDGAQSGRQRKRRRAGGNRLENADSWRSGRYFQIPLPERSNQRNADHHRKKFQYGNYNKYYGYRNPGLSEDPRIRVLKAEWFRGRDVLDLGCNTGHLTLFVAKNWRPARIVGLDIDAGLIHAARQNVRHYLSEVLAQKTRENGENVEKVEVDLVQENEKSKPSEADPAAARAEGEDGFSVDTTDGKHSFPVSLRISRGPIAGPPLPETDSPSPGEFPANVTFVRGNYVLESDMLLQGQKEEYDVILCLSVTKWVHLNWGDAGLKRLFHRVYRHLRPGGLFILEPQPWNSYGKRKRLTEAICKNYHSIQLKPDQFSSFLTTDVGFSSYELSGTSQNFSRGFQRPIYLFHKGSSRHK